MTAPTEDRPLRLDHRSLHLCVDMQRLFAEGTDWHTPWMTRVLPVVERLVAAHPERTVFTRFIPAQRPGEGEGTWLEYYRRWSSMTLEALPPGTERLMPELERFVPPAAVVDKTVYSPWMTPELDALLRERGTESLIITGAETDVCVLAAVLGAVDRGYRVVLATDGVCSSSDHTHDALLTLYQDRYGGQVQAATVKEILAAWH
ncbi:cysteine hydrolase family protein [Roseomonas elaeocarpi]|uniref:Cysteine hydrolase family protein n=1 Tax=Roseomonas elaeocarpi TaxID=907779 RepID=A0ABV6JYN6_9PROT